MSQDISLLLRSLNGGAPIRVNGTQNPDGTITMTVADAVPAGSQAMLLLHNPQGGEPVQLIVTVNNDGTITVPDYKSPIPNAQIIFYNQGQGQPISTPVVFDTDGVVDFGEVSFEGGDTPTFVSAEIGTVNGSTVVVTFSSACETPPVVEIKENGVVATNDGGTIQGDPTIVYYVIPIPWHGADDVITVDGNAVTNNIAWNTLLDLQADTLAIGAVSTWEDQSINGNDFTQTGDARPTAGLDTGYMAVLPDAVDDWMLGGDFANALSSFAVVVTGDPDLSISRLGDDDCTNEGSVGWIMQLGLSMVLYSSLNDYRTQAVAHPEQSENTFFFVVDSYSELHIYVNGVLSDTQADGGDVYGTGATSISNAFPVRLFTDGSGGTCDAFAGGVYRAIGLMYPAPPVADIAAWSNRVNARYGLS